MIDIDNDDDDDDEDVIYAGYGLNDDCNYKNSTLRVLFEVFLDSSAKKRESSKKGLVYCRVERRRRMMVVLCTMFYNMRRKTRHTHPLISDRCSLPCTCVPGEITDHVTNS